VQRGPSDLRRPCVNGAERGAGDTVVLERTKRARVGSAWPWGCSLFSLLAGEARVANSQPSSLLRDDFFLLYLLSLSLSLSLSLYVVVPERSRELVER
jgi:hypothetical protein